MAAELNTEKFEDFIAAISDLMNIAFWTPKNCLWQERVRIVCQAGV